MPSLGSFTWRSITSATISRTRTLIRRCRAWSATTSSSSVLGAEQASPCREQLDLRRVGDESFALVDYVTAVAGIRRDDRDADQRPPMQVEMTRLGRGDVETPPQLRDDRPHDGSFLLQ